MKSLYESLLTGNVRRPSAKVQPSSRDELKQIIDEHIKQIKPHPGQEVDLNWIDISRVDDLRQIFENTDYIPVIDAWKIDHVKDFKYMFDRNKYIVHSPLPVLQKKLLARNCYMGMFYGCTNLEKPPVLPAMKMSSWCYWNMFSGCTSLKVAPKLPAKELAECCYYAMFDRCTALEEPPQLPATTLANGCYKFMFVNCTALKKQAKIPKNVPMDRADYTYNMYAGCTNIKD